jgi:hypothetical protein
MNIELLFKEFVWDELVKKAFASLLVKLPFLAWGPISWLVQPLLQMFADKIYDFVHEEVDVAYIPIKNKVLQDGWAKSVLALKLTAQNYGIDSEQFKKEREYEKDKLRKLVNFGTV